MWQAPRGNPTSRAPRLAGGRGAAPARERSRSRCYSSRRRVRGAATGFLGAQSRHRSVVLQAKELEIKVKETFVRIRQKESDDESVDLEIIAAYMRSHPCPLGPRPRDYLWWLRSELFDEDFMRVLAELPETSAQGHRIVFRFLEDIVRTGYSHAIGDRHQIVNSGMWMALKRVFSEAQNWKEHAAPMWMYVHLAEHFFFYEEGFGRGHLYWDCEIFRPVVRAMPKVLLMELSADMTAPQWEAAIVSLEMVLKTVACFMSFWAFRNHGHQRMNDVIVTEALEVVDAILTIVHIQDPKFAGYMCAKSRGNLLEELLRTCGSITGIVVLNSEDSQVETMKDETVRLLLHKLFGILMLQIPTCSSFRPGGEFQPVEERQVEAEWIEGLWDQFDDERPSPSDMNLLQHLFKVVRTLPVQEQRCRLECLSSVIPIFVNEFAESLRENTIPVELRDLKAVMNTVIQDDSGATTELLDELAYFPVLLDFNTKRTSIHALCERHRLNSNDNMEPVRLVVPRDSVLDNVCGQLHLDDPEARIDAPLEIEFRSGFWNENGDELVEEGEDQGGLRRQWLDRGTRYFLQSDLFMSPSEDTDHIGDEAPVSSTHRSVQGQIFVPSPVAVCRCVQEDWEEQFELFGCILGVAIFYKETVPVHFGHNFLRSVFGIKITAQDLLPLLDLMDHSLHAKLKYILDGTYHQAGETLDEALETSNLSTYFVTTETRCEGFVRPTPLKENGEWMPVLETNKEEYVLLLLEHILVNGIKQQVDCFRRGLLRVVPENIVKRIGDIMTVKEIELMVCGVDEIDVEDWERFTVYENGYDTDSRAVIWFWEVVREMPMALRAALLAFATGSCQVPSGGFRFLQPDPFTVQRVAVTDRFPETHTCANTLDLPAYGSKEILKTRLLFAIQECGDGFGRR